MNEYVILKKSNSILSFNNGEPIIFGDKDEAINDLNEGERIIDCKSEIEIQLLVVRRSDNDKIVYAMSIYDEYSVIQLPSEIKNLLGINYSEWDARDLVCIYRTGYEVKIETHKIII